MRNTVLNLIIPFAFSANLSVLAKGKLHQDNSANYMHHNQDESNKHTDKIQSDYDENHEDNI